MTIKTDDHKGLWMYFLVAYAFSYRYSGYPALWQHTALLSLQA